MATLHPDLLADPTHWALLDSVSDLVWLKDTRSRVTRANRAASESAGLAPETISGMPASELYPEQAPLHAELELRIIRTGRSRLGSVEPLSTPSGRRWLRTDRHPVLGDDGSVIAVLVIASDITDLLASEQRLDELSQRLELSMAGAKLAAWDWNCVTNTVVFNDAWYTMLGYQPGELPMEFATSELLVHPDDLLLARACLEDHVAGRTERYEATVRMRTRSGEWKWIRTIGEVFGIDHAGRPIRMAGVHIDIDEIVRARLMLERANADLGDAVAERTRALENAGRRFERVIGGSQNGVWEWTVDTQACWFSSTFWTLLGFGRGDCPADTLHSLSDRLHPDDFADAWAEIRATVATGRILTGRYRLRVRNGSYRWFSFRAAATNDGPGGRLVLSGSIVDVNDAVLAEQALLRAKDELEARVASRTAELREHVVSLADRNEQLDQFAHVASHDLRGPLRTITGNAELALRTSDGAERSRFLERVLAGAQRMSMLLDGLSAYSRVGRTELAPATIDLDTLAAEIIQDLQADIDDRAADVSAGPLGTVHADARLIRQVLLNLISNAIKFVKDRRPRVRIERCGSADLPAIRIVDNGIGIDPGYAEYIFEPFTRLHASADFPGSGVGLSVCRRAIERHGGTIGVRPAPGGGSVFTFTLPGPSGPTTRQEAPA